MRSAVLAVLLMLTACGSAPAPAARSSSSPGAIPTATAGLTPSLAPLASPSANSVPSWAAMSANCTGSPSAHEALLAMQGSPATVLADVADALHPQTLCTLTGNWLPQLVTQRMISWSAQQTPGQTSLCMIVTMDLFSGAVNVVASWQGGLFNLNPQGAPSAGAGLQSWSPDESSMAYVANDGSRVNNVNLHLLSGGVNRVVASYGGQPGRGIDQSEDDAFLGFSADGAYFAFVQTFTDSAQLQIRRTKDGTLAYSQPTGTMAVWSSTGARLFFREPRQTTIHVWDPVSSVSQLFALHQAWLFPSADAGDDYVAYTVLDSTGNNPHVRLYGHDGRSGGELANVRSTPLFLNTTSIFMFEYASCPPSCGFGAQPDGHTFIYDLAKQSETASNIAVAISSWPRIGQT